MLYLILHKVRGEAAFDVAQKIVDMSRDEDWWIIPTSGHRAYPYAYLPLSDLEATGLDRGFFDITTWLIPDDWPDHYAPSSLEPRPKAAAPAQRSITSIEDLLI